PGKRYPSALELAEDLQRYLGGEPVRARRVRGPERLWRWCRRRPTTALLAASLLLSLAGGIALVTVLWRQAEGSLRQARSDRAQAEESFRRAHRAVNLFCPRVSEGRMRDTPGLQPVRKELLESALAYYEQFLREHAQDPTLHEELADTYFR